MTQYTYDGYEKILEDVAWIIEVEPSIGRHQKSNLLVKINDLQKNIECTIDGRNNEEAAFQERRNDRQ
jgi:hypothetical protein|tara:strand:+ start:182 stop:385 length:204 start_codon:yes stop_codon:yes gene_type:complete